MNLPSDASPLVLLETDRAPVQVAQLPSLGGASLPRLLKIADLLTEVPRRFERLAEIRDLAASVWTSSRGLKSPWASASAWMRNSRNGRASNSAASAPTARVTSAAAATAAIGRPSPGWSVRGRRRMRHQHSPRRSRHRLQDGEPLLAVLIHIDVGPGPLVDRGGTVVEARVFTAGSAPGGDDLPVRDHRDQRVPARKGSTAAPSRSTERRPIAPIGSPSA